MKLSRKTLEAALADFEARGVVRGKGGNLEAFEAAARALIAVMEPASDEEASQQAMAAGYRAAEARARRLAEWETE